MTTKLYVGNLHEDVGDDELRELFQTEGEVLVAYVVRDRDSHVSRGFGFVEYGSALAIPVALKKLHRALLRGQPIIVRSAREKTGGGR